MRLSKLARTEPELPATVELKQSEIDAIILTKKKTKYSRGQVPTIGEAVLWLAEIGGYTGKTSGGPPGAEVLSRGIMRIQALADYLESGAEK
jgi:Transposase Tn5 dimerisation domain